MLILYIIIIEIRGWKLIKVFRVLSILYLTLIISENNENREKNIQMKVVLILLSAIIQFFFFFLYVH